MSKEMTDKQIAYSRINEKDSEPEEFEITIKVNCTKEEADEALAYLRKLQYSFTHNDVPEQLREGDIYLQDEPRTFVALEKRERGW